MFACVWDGVALVVEQAPDQAQHLHVDAPVHAMGTARLQGAHTGKFALPVAQHVRLHADDVRRLTDLEEAFVG